MGQIKVGAAITIGVENENASGGVAVEEIRPILSILIQNRYLAKRCRRLQGSEFRWVETGCLLSRVFPRGMAGEGLFDLSSEFHPHVDQPVHSGEDRLVSGEDGDQQKRESDPQFGPSE